MTGASRPSIGSPAVSCVERARQTRGGPPGGGPQLAEQSGVEHAERLAEPVVDLRLGERARQRLEDRLAQVKTLSGNSKLKNVASHFSYCVAAGST